jgi:hypothetical protein
MWHKGNAENPQEGGETEKNDDDAAENRKRQTGGT